MPTLSSIRPLLLLTAFAATLVLAGCGSDSDETTGGGTRIVPVPAQDEPTEAPVGVRAKVCRSDDAADGEVRVTGIPCGFARLAVAGWQANEACAVPPDASRTSCKLGGFNCLGVRTDRGLVVTCAASGRSVVFIAKRP